MEEYGDFDPAPDAEMSKPSEFAQTPVWTADSEDPAERMEREEQEAAREPWEPFLSEFELAVVERVLLVTATAQIYGETGDEEWALMAAQHLMGVQSLAGGRKGLVDLLATIGPRLSELQARMARNETRGLFEGPF